MACRSGIPEAGEDVRAAPAATTNVEMIRVDLSEFDSIDRVLRASCEIERSHST